MYVGFSHGSRNPGLKNSPEPCHAVGNDCDIMAAQAKRQN